jgi:pyrroloquinoline quinone biosynthesis protein D
MLDANCRPRLAAGCRFSEASGEETSLLMPERMLRLNPSALQILKLCDGRTFTAIVDTLHANFAEAPRERIAADTSTYLEKLQALRAVDLEAEG